MTRAAVRESQAAVAMIREWHDASWKYLCHWSTSWHALHFVGGHREAGETFRQCAVREAAEELALGPTEFAVAAEPLGHLEYVAFSRSAGVPTFYVIEVFLTVLEAAVAGSGPARCADNRWVMREEIRAERTTDGTPVSPTAELILSMLGL